MLAHAHTVGLLATTGPAGPRLGSREYLRSETRLSDERLGDLMPAARILMGPGPTMADPRVLRAMSSPLLGQFDPDFTRIMNEVMDLARFVFQTANAGTFPISGTGRAALEAAIVSLVEPGDRVVVGECGRFGLLLIEIAERCGALVVPVRAEWGRSIEPEAIEAALRAAPRTRMVAMIHGETSTGVLQPLEDIARLCRRHDTLLLADAVVTLGGSEVATDRWQVDVMVAGAQKCLSCPSGLSPLTYNDRAAAVMAARASTVRSNYLDLIQLARYWSPARFNHHTAPTTMVYGLREALRAISEEGLDARFARHRLHADALRAGIAALGLRLFGAGPAERRLAMITPVLVPDGIDELRVRHELIQDFGIEIGGAFGPLEGRIWRIGTMGYAAERRNVLLCLAALEQVLRRQGWRADAGAGVDGAVAHYAAAGAAPDADTTDNLGARGMGRY
jgi:(S)-ureidoglycine-glyoxylate aminotransferase